MPIDAPPADWGKFKIPPGWSIYFYWYVTSGEAYTPKDSEGRNSGEDYSRNGPVESQLSMKLSKVFKLRGDRILEVVFQGWNILNRKNATEVDPQTGEPYEPGVGTLSRNNTLYYRTQYGNPAYFGVPRNFRLAVSYEW